MDRPENFFTTPLGGLIVVGIALGLLIGAVTLVIDNQCYNEMSTLMPVYPGAEVEFEEYNFLRPYGIGETVMILYSEDDSRTVGAWYGRTTGAAYREMGRRISDTNWSVTRAQDGTGTQIFLSGACG